MANPTPTLKKYLQSFSPHQPIHLNGVKYAAWDLLSILAQANDARLALTLSEMSNGNLTLVNGDGSLNTTSFITIEEKHK